MARQFNKVNCVRGAPMGRSSYGVATQCKSRLNLFKVKLVDGGYDDGGAYWGMPNNLYCAQDKDGLYRAFTRAEDREAARVALGIPQEWLFRPTVTAKELTITAALPLFLNSYLVCALWASNDCNEEGTDCIPLDSTYGVEDIAPATVAEAEEECRTFIVENYKTLLAAMETKGYTWRSAGNDFWLTRCGHGAGFWDRGLGEVGERLTESARLSGNRDAYVGDDSLIYFS